MTDPPSKTVLTQPTAVELTRVRWLLEQAERHAQDHSDPGRHFAVIALDGAVEHCLFAVAAAERLAAAAQVVMADLASDDLTLLPTSIRIVVNVEVDPARCHAARRDRNGLWSTVLRTAEEGAPLDPKETSHELLTSLVAVVSTVSLFPPKDVMDAIERAFIGGLPHKLCPVRPYDELVPLSTAEFGEMCRADAEPPLSIERPPPRCHAA